jgi:hypothetical protein
MGQIDLWIWAFFGFPEAGGDKAPLPSPVKASTCLMHDSHNARRESLWGGALALDSGRIERVTRPLDGKPAKNVSAD